MSAAEVVSYEELWAVVQDLAAGDPLRLSDKLYGRCVLCDASLGQGRVDDHERACPWRRSWELSDRLRRAEPGTLAEELLTLRAAVRAGLGLMKMADLLAIIDRLLDMEARERRGAG